MTIDGKNIEPNTLAYIQLLKDMESDDESAALVVHAVSPLSPCHQQKAGPCVDEADTEMDDCEDCTSLGLYRRTARIRSAQVDQPAAVALMRRQAF